MGCDIHLVVERIVGEKWICVDTLSAHYSRYAPIGTNVFSAPVATERNYRRFAKLAGVRGEGPEPKGIPDDVSETARLLIDDWGNDGHSHSYMPIEEAAAIFLATDSEGAREDKFVSEFSSSHYFNHDSDFADGAEHRVVFWFDN